MAFNNLVCAQLPLPAADGSPASAPTAAPEQRAVPSNNTLDAPSPLYVEYAPVVYLNQNQNQASSDSWQSDVNSVITFLVRSTTLRSQNQFCVDLTRVHVDWLERSAVTYSMSADLLLIGHI